MYNVFKTIDCSRSPNFSFDRRDRAQIAAIFVFKQRARTEKRDITIEWVPRRNPSTPTTHSVVMSLSSVRSRYLKTKMAAICARSRRSNGKIGDCEQSIQSIPLVAFHGRTVATSKTTLFVPNYTIPRHKINLGVLTALTLLTDKLVTHSVPQAKQDILLITSNAIQKMLSTWYATVALNNTLEKPNEAD